MSTPLGDAQIEQLVGLGLIADLAVLYDRFAHALDPFSPERDHAERVFMQQVAQIHDQCKAEAYPGMESIQFHDFRKAIIFRCKRYLAAN